MSDSFVTKLQSYRPDPATLPHAMRYFVSATAGDPPIGRLRDELISRGLEPEQIEQAVDLLQRDPAVMEAAALAVLQEGWADPTKREVARGALTAANTKLPVVEAAVISIVAVYGMWVAATKGRRSHERVIRRGPDGSWEESEKTEWYGPSGPLEAIGRVLGLRPPTATDEASDALPDGSDPTLPPPSENS